jgi:predicted phage terminase large subunit-like protein
LNISPTAIQLSHELRKRNLKASLNDWCTHCLAPLNLKPQAHHKLLIEKLEAVERGDIKRLMVMMPPGAAKSTYSTILFTPWFLARKEGRSVILASHTADLADSNSKKIIRNIAEFGGDIGIATTSTSAQSWATDNRGEVKSAGVGGPITGRRADCLVGDTQITTPNGLRFISDIYESQDLGCVVSYDATSGQKVTRKVVAARKKKATEVCRVRTSAGSVVEATGNHPFFTERGWVSAGMLASGDVLMRELPETTAPKRLRDEQGTKAWRAGGLLQRLMFRHAYERRTRRKAASVQDLRSADGPIKTSLLAKVQKSIPCSQACVEQIGAVAGARLRDVWDFVHTSVQGVSGALLLSPLQRQRAFSGHRWGQKSIIQARSGKSVRQSTRVVQGQAGDLGAGRDGLRSLPIEGQNRCASYQHDADRSPIDELGLSLQEMPSGPALGGAFRACRDVVISVERIRRDCDVYDIQVDGTECFFANGVLVHNCALIDDPVKSRADADSETYRETTWNWFWSDLCTRLKPNAGVVIIMTRWHSDDLAGRLLESSSGDWDVVSIPAEAEEGDMLGRAPGEFLWDNDPDYGYGAQLRGVKDTLLKVGATRDWYSLYQQRPRPAEGALFKILMVGTEPAAPAGGTIVRAWDLAATKAIGTRDPDWTAGVKLMRTSEGKFIVLDVVRLRGGPDEVEAAIVNTAKQDGPSVRISLPQDPGQAGKQQVLYLTRKLTGYRVDSSPETGDKSTRAYPVSSQVNVGNFAVVKAPWNRAFLDEVAGFPSGTHDDQVDALSRAFSMLSARPVMKISAELLARI